MTETTDTISLTMSRYLPATPDEVFDAYTDQEKQTIWFSILDETPGVVRIDVDLRVGGQQKAVWGPSEDELYWENQTFKVIDRPNRLVSTSTGGTPDGQSMTTEIEVTFEPQGEGTLVTVVQSGFPDTDSRDFFESMVWVGAFDRIEAFLVRK
jgi:uncharacterized protein YndB with AHSA1/START domain